MEETLVEFMNRVRTREYTTDDWINWLSSIYHYNQTTDKFAILKFILQTLGNLGKYIDNQSLHILINDIVVKDDLHTLDLFVQHGYFLDSISSNTYIVASKIVMRRPLYIAITNGYADIVDYIINNNGKILYKDLMASIKYDRYTIFLTLLHYLDKIELDGEDVVYDCLRFGEQHNFLPYLEKIISTGFDVNIKSTNGGLTGYELAVGFYNPHFIDGLIMMLNAGADPNTYDFEYDEDTLITHLLCDFFDYRHDTIEKAIDLLLSFGADIHISFNEYETVDNRERLENIYPKLYQKYFDTKPNY